MYNERILPKKYETEIFISLGNVILDEKIISNIIRGKLSHVSDWRRNGIEFIQPI